MLAELVALLTSLPAPCVHPKALSPRISAQSHVSVRRFNHLEADRKATVYSAPASRASCVVASMGMSDELYDSQMSAPAIAALNKEQYPLDAEYERLSREQTFRKLAPADILPPLPDGRRVSLALGSLAECDTGGRVWGSAAVLCQALSERASELRGQNVLELGCGTGAVGIFAAGLGAKRVMLTDGGSPVLLELAATNVHANRGLWEANGAEVRVAAHSWGEDADEDDDALTGFQWIIGSDVTYAVHAHHALCASIATQLRKRSHGAQVLIAHQHRRDETEATDGRQQSFVCAAEATGLRVTEIDRVMHQGGRSFSLLRVEDTEEGSTRTTT